ncbi:MAG: hypothetical protein C0619_04770 [Desulfuromonas sp.]|jgi:hypothetical protein|nr:MAG: hypothetical protein C0619_04770 [Desulfuromonas sp.]
MMIRVMYPNGDYDMVRNDLLDLLVANHRVKKFKRSSGWIDIDRENARLRTGPNPKWDGVERRVS